LNPGRIDLRLPPRIAESWHLWTARLALLGGFRGFARAGLKAALRRNPVSFPARFLLGRIYLGEMAIAKARREFDLAWQIDPDRFELAYGRLKARFRGAPDLLAGTGTLPWDADPAETGRPGDFRDEDEARHFAGLPPITRQEVEEIDWDRFAEEIFKDHDGDA